MKRHAQFLIGEPERMKIKLVTGSAEVTIDDELLWSLRNSVERKGVLANKAPLAIGDDQS
jgi:hypothetical protein